MLFPRIACRSAAIVKSAPYHHKILLFVGIGRSETAYLQQVSKSLAPSFRYLSTNKNDNGSESVSSSHLDTKKKKDVKEACIVKEQSTAESPPSSLASVDIHDNKIKQLQPQKPVSFPTESSAVPSRHDSSSAPTTPSAQTAANVPKESTNDSSLALSKNKHSSPVVPAKESGLADGGALSEYYDKVFRLWSERSGTSEILMLKESVNEAGAAFDSASAEVTVNRRNLDDALRKWERASGQHLQLLQRRESWTPEDAQRFADFVSLEITSRAELEQARHDLARSEELLTKSQLDYINKMRRRYHEEQIWQDQWRVLGTYGTWTLIVLNSCVFLGSQFFQRRRERERTETIERLILESKSDGIPAATGETPAAEIAMEDTTTKNVVATKTEEGEAKNESLTNQEELASVDSLGSESEGTAIVEEIETLPREGHEPNRSRPAIERIGAAVSSVGSFVNRWEHRMRSNAKELGGSIHRQLHQALPANIANEIPKSVSEIHVPSAIIGASVGGITALTLSMIFSAFSNRRY